MNIIAVSGSLRRGSSNTALLSALPGLAPEGMRVSMAAPLDRLPHFNPDLEGEHLPPAAAEWLAELRAADGVVICSPEYAHGIPGVLKNALDWDVSHGGLYRKPVLLIHASPNHLGAEKSQAQLIQVLGAMQADLAGAVSVPAVRKKLADGGSLADPELIGILRDGLAKLAAAIERNKG